MCMRSSIVPLVILFSAACGKPAAEQADTAQPAQPPASVASEGYPVDSTGRVPPPRQPSPAELAAWQVVADSVMRVHLAKSLFVAPDGLSPNMFECGGDAGSENPTTGLAAARTRILGRDSVRVDWAWDYQGLDTIPMLATSYTVEVTSAARMVPNWIAGVSYRNDTIMGDEAYVFEVGPRLDTVHITLEDVTRMTPRWAVCSPVLARSEPGYGFLTFVHADRPWPKAILWKPANSSWDRIRGLADSLGAP